MNKLVKYVCADILRNRIVIGYTAFLLLISMSVFSLEDNASKGLLSLLNVVLIIVPLVSVIFSTIYVYNSAEFIELLVSQPLRRKQLWSSLFIGLAGSLSLAFLIGVGIPLIVFDATKPDGTPLKRLDVTKIAKLGWQHRMSLRDGIEKTYEWYKQHG